MAGRRKKRALGAERRGGFSYFVTNEQIREWSRMPIEHRLMWLEEANRFNEQVVRGRRRRIMEAFREGKI